MPKLSDQEIDELCDLLNIPASGREVIKRIRSSEPSRRVKSCGSNVTCRYPSKKMGFTIQAESHKVELCHVYKMEHDDNVREYYDQPLPLKLVYKNINDRNLGVMHHADYFEIRDDFIGYVECKKEVDLENLAKKHPNRYVKTDGGKWICPPGIEAAANNALSYEIRTDKDFTWEYIENIEFFEDYLDLDCPPVPEDEARAVIKILNDNKVISIKSLIDDHDIKSDNIYKLIADKIIYFDIQNSRITDIDSAYVFTDKLYADAYNYMILDSNEAPLYTVQDISLESGTLINWDGKIWRILNAGNNNIILEPEDGNPIALSIKVFEDLVKKGDVTAIQTNNENKIEAEITAAFAKTRPQDLQKAISRQEIIIPILNGEVRVEDIKNISSRTLYKWLADYKEALREFGVGLIGLIPRIGSRGNRTPKLEPRIYELMDEEAKKSYENAIQKNVNSSHHNLGLTCEKEGLQLPSLKTFANYLKSRPKENQIEKRQGRRAAYKHEIAYWNIERETPKHGTRPFHIGHIDHTELDLELVDHKGRNLGKAWLTILIDAYSRRILAFYISFKKPSYISAMMVLRECVRRHQKLPKIIVVDNGPEFGSIAFEGLLARHVITKKSRPKSKSRFGSVCERFFGTTNTEFVYNLTGNTQLTKTVRLVTKNHNPKKLAIWTLSQLKMKLSEFLYEVYDQDIHPALDDSPRTTFERDMIYFGSRYNKLIPYTNEFIISTYPSTEKGTAKINRNTGVQVYYIKYWHECLRDPKVSGRSVPVKFNPEDVGVIYVFVQGRWVECHSEYYTIFKGKSHKLIAIASDEIRKRKSDTQKRKQIKSRDLALFIQSTQEHEALMIQQNIDKEEFFANELSNVENFCSNDETPIKDTLSATEFVLENEEDIPDLGDL